jgi:TonB family protein
VPSYDLTDPPQALEEPDLHDFYPEAARKEGVEGQVLLLLSVDAHGSVVRARVVAPAGHGFDEAAVQAATQKLRFKPATRNGTSVGTEIQYTMMFLVD